MRFFPVLECSSYFLKMHPVPVGFGGARNHGFRSYFAFFDLFQEIGFSDRTNRFRTAKKALFHKVPVSGHEAVPPKQTTEKRDDCEMTEG